MAGVVTMKERTFYLSGPMTGIEDFNFPAFRETTERLRNIFGYKVFPAHEIDHGVEPGGLTWSEYLRNDLIVMLQKCDAIILMPGWTTSKGAALECLVAQRLNWPLYYFDIGSHAKPVKLTSDLIESDFTK